jgi:capsular polysaccharide transport system ATP-binding protein
MRYADVMRRGLDARISQVVMSRIGTMTGMASAVAAHPRRIDLGPGPLRPNFTLKGVTLRIKERGKFVKVFDDMSAEFPRGRNLLVLGNRDAGIKPLVRLLTGMENPRVGRVSRNVRMSWPINFTGHISLDFSMRENAMFIARLYGENTRSVSEFIRDMLGITKEFDGPLSNLTSETRKYFPLALVLAIEFDCYILDKSVLISNKEFRARWESALAERLRTADLIQVTNKVKFAHPCHEMGAILEDGKLRMMNTAAAAIAAFNEKASEPDMDDLDDDSEDDGDDERSALL